jgi:bacteriocin resistance YdeI/OmpD-like protein/uncharacterized protein DUF1905
MPGKRKFTAMIENAGGGGAFVRVPFDVEEEFGSKRPRVRAWIDGVVYRGTLVRMGSDYHILGVLKEIRAQIGKDVGDEVEVVVERDTERRTVEIPPDLLTALKKDREAKSAFEKMAYSHQREYARHIMEAKKPETRARRIAQAVEMLKMDKREP